MHKITGAVIGAFLFASIVSVPTVARADCAANARALEASLAANPGNANAERVSNMIAKARAALADGKKNKCAKIVAKAQGVLAEGGKAVASRGGGGGDCAAEIADLERRMTGMPSNHVRHEELRTLLFNARKDAEEGRQKKCAAKTKKVATRLTNMGY